MRIGLDATRALIPDGGGVYTREVVRHLLRECPDDHFVVAVPEHMTAFEAPHVEQIVYGEVDGIPARLRYALAMGRLARRQRLDVFHNLTNYAVLGAPCPVVTTVLDLVSLKFPAVRMNRLHGLIYRHVFPWILPRSERLVAISRQTAADIETHYGLGARTSTIYCGIDREWLARLDGLDDALIERFALPPGYLLFVGYLSPKKNMEVVLEAMHRLGQQGIRPHLVLVGKRGYGSQAFFARAAELGLSARLIETGFVSQDELAVLYRNAGLFVFPSIYEGFGLPVVEAMACGAPVLVSRAGPLPELVYDPACLCDPQDADAWARGIRGALTDTAARAAARLRGPEQARRFSWEEGARRMRALYAEVVGEQRVETA